MRSLAVGEVPRLTLLKWETEIDRLPPGQLDRIALAGQKIALAKIVKLLKKEN